MSTTIATRLLEQDWDLISSYTGLLTLAMGSVYAGSFGSLKRRSHKTDKASKDEQEDDEDEEEDTERMSSGDAWLFPVLGSGTLVGLYVIVKYLGPEWINWLLGWYFALAGVVSVWKTSVAVVKSVMGRQMWNKFDKVCVEIKKGGQNWLRVSLNTPSIVLMPLSVIPSALYALSADTRKSVFLTNVLALSFSHTALSLLKIDSFNTGCILLSGLFFYDIWWVFGTEVMVKVATNLDVPIKLLWPKSLAFSSARGYTMLGLGDVVIPGTFVALALRYDYYRSKAGKEGAFAKPYFLATLAAYGLGLVVTMGVVHVFAKAQPALLYLSPACILSWFGTAVLRGEVEEVWRWSDVPEEGHGKQE